MLIMWVFDKLVCENTGIRYHATVLLLGRYSYCSDSAEFSLNHSLLIFTHLLAPAQRSSINKLVLTDMQMHLIWYTSRPTGRVLYKYCTIHYRDAFMYWFRLYCPIDRLQGDCEVHCYSLYNSALFFIISHVIVCNFHSTLTHISFEVPSYM